MFEISDIFIEEKSVLKEGKELLITDTDKPVISFQLQSDRRETSLRSACIRVNNWIAEVKEQIGIKYEGEPLKPFTRYDVEIEAVDDRGNNSTKCAEFMTGRKRLPWSGKWITDEMHVTEKPNSPRPLYFRRKIHLEKAVGRTTNISNTNQSVSLLTADRQALLAEWYIVYKDGSREVVSTDGAYEVTADGPYQYADFYDGEIYDARFKETDWKWRKADVITPDIHPMIEARYGEPVTGHEIFAPISCEEVYSNCTGQIFVRQSRKSVITAGMESRRMHRASPIWGSAILVSAE